MCASAAGTARPRPVRAAGAPGSAWAVSARMTMVIVVGTVVALGQITCSEPVLGHAHQRIGPGLGELIGPVGPLGCTLLAPVSKRVQRRQQRIATGSGEEPAGHIAVEHRRHMEPALLLRRPRPVEHGRRRDAMRGVLGMLPQPLGPLGLGPGYQHRANLIDDHIRLMRRARRGPQQ